MMSNALPEMKPHIEDGGEMPQIIEETIVHSPCNDNGDENDDNDEGVSMRDYIETMRNRPGAFSVRGPQEMVPRSLSTSSSENAAILENSNVENQLPVADVVPTDENEIVAYAMVPEEHIAVDNLTTRLTKEKNKFFNTMKLLIIISVTILIATLILVLFSFTFTGRDVLIDDRQRFLNESISLQALREIVLGAKVSNELDLFDPFSPQYRAMNWLANIDSIEKIKTCKGLNDSNPPRTSYLLNCTDFDNEIMQRYILGVIFFATNGGDWTQNSSYLSSSHECEWKEERSVSGVLIPPSISCDADRNVAEIHLYSIHLNGTVPNEIGNLTNLKTLFLGDNDLTGTIPTSLSNLKKLERFHICCNLLTGTLPDVTNLKNITFFSVWQNYLTGTIGEHISEMSNIDIMHLGENKFTGTLPDVFDKFPRMTAFYAEANSFTGTIPRSLTNLKNLEVLTLGENSFQGVLPNSLGNMKTLRSLSLDRNKLSGSIPDSFKNLRAISKIDLSRNSFTGSLPKSMVNLTELMELDLSINQISGNINFLCQPVDPDNNAFYQAEHSTIQFVVLKADCLKLVDCECCTHCF